MSLKQSGTVLPIKISNSICSCCESLFFSAPVINIDQEIFIIVIDLKVIRAGVDFIFDNFLPFFDEGEENISRQDIITKDG